MNWYQFLLMKSIDKNTTVENIKNNPKYLLEYQKMTGGRKVHNKKSEKERKEEYYKDIGESIIRVLQGDNTGYLLDNLIRSLQMI